MEQENLHSCRVPRVIQVFSRFYARGIPGMTGRLHLSPAEWPARSGNIPSLDGVRGCSILLVLVGHMLLPTSLVGISAIGLKVFFVLSGFLITRLLLAENKHTGHINLRNFYVRRLLRLYPVIIAYVCITSAVLLIRGQSVPPLELISVFLYLVPNVLCTV